MNIQCVDEATALQVQTVLWKHGIQYRIPGPYVDDTTITVMSTVTIPRKKEPTIRREIQRIAGATIGS